MDEAREAYELLTESIGTVAAVGPWLKWDELTDDLRIRYGRFAVRLRAQGWNPGTGLYERDLGERLVDPVYRREFLDGVAAQVRDDEKRRIIALLNEKAARADFRGNGPMFNMGDVVHFIAAEGLFDTSKDLT